MDPFILIADQQILDVPIVENHEPMIDLRMEKGIQYGPSPEIPNNTDYTRMRLSVYDKLKQAQRLLPEGLLFCLYEGYRSLSLQKMLYEARYEKIKKQNPHWTHPEIFAETIKMISPVINLDGSNNIPPHSTGAAVDIYLIDVNGQAIDMGIHPQDWMEDLDGTLSLTRSNQISAIAQLNRELMATVLTEVGFVNYPTEYWHWSYGDRYWGFHNRSPAVYDTVSIS